MKRAKWKPQKSSPSTFFSTNNRVLIFKGVWLFFWFWGRSHPSKGTERKCRCIEEAAQAQMLLLSLIMRHFGSAAGSSGEWEWRQWWWRLERRSEQGLQDRAASWAPKQIGKTLLGTKHFRNLCPFSRVSKHMPRPLENKVFSTWGPTSMEQGLLVLLLYTRRQLLQCRVQLYGS